MDKAWKFYKLDQLGFVGRGKSKHRPRNDPALYGGKYPFFQTGDIKAANLRLTEYSQTYNEEGLAQSKIWQPGTLCITIAANIADTAILGIPGCFPDSVVGFIPHADRADAKFIKYYIDTIKIKMQNVSKGTTQDNLSLDKLLSFDFVIPSVTVQRRIASILSAYDDLIENNTRRIAILEEMARRIYEEWFVHFRFPGHEKVRMVESALGLIPEGWKIQKLEKLAVVVTKGTTPTTLGKQFQIEGVNFFKVESIDQNGGIEENKLAKIDFETHEILKRSQLKSGDILFSIAGAIGRTTIVPKRMLPANTNQALAIIRIPDETYRTYIFHCVRANEFQHFSLGRVVQTAQANVSLGILKSAPILIPPDELLREFAKLASSIAQMQENLRTRNTNLRTTRDLLLPKLISGELDVSQLPEPAEII